MSENGVDHTPEPKLSNPEILERELEKALRQLKRPTGGLLLGGIGAGLNVSLGALLMGIVLTYASGFPSPLIKQLALANASAIGFVIVIIGQSELFTAHSTMGILPVLDRRASLPELGRLWSIIYVGNLIGCVLFAGLIAMLGPSLGVVESAAFGSLANALLSFAGPTIFLSAVVAGWLMGLVTWLVSAARDTVGQIVIVWILTAIIGFGPFHHCILGTTEVLSALFSGNDVAFDAMSRFLTWTTLGNIVGGAVFVALLKYGQTVKAGERQNVDYEAGEADEA